jgi:hypothetical protein
VVGAWLYGVQTRGDSCASQTGRLIDGELTPVRRFPSSGFSLIAGLPGDVASGFDGASHAGAGSRPKGVPSGMLLSTQGTAPI